MKQYNNCPEQNLQRRERVPQLPAEGVIEGRNAVHEALRAGRQIDKIFYLKGDDGMLTHLAMRARQTGAVIVSCDRRKLDAMSQTGAHQGIIAMAAAHEYVGLDEILEGAAASGRPPLLVLCDEISDPHNLGAIIRSAEAAGAHGVVIPKRRNAGLTSVVEKASAGALEHIPIARVSNLTAAIKELKKAGLWIFGTGLYESSVNLYDSDLKGPCGIVIGSEGEGLSRLVREECDFLLRIPMLGKIESLNASAAAAVVLFETLRQREIVR